MLRQHNIDNPGIIMRMTKRVLALALSGLMLAACSHKDKDAPLAFVPADTPYVIANLDVLDDSTRAGILAQVDAEMPAQIAQMKAQAEPIRRWPNTCARWLASSTARPPNR
jgi:uncharacterized lipoprotein YajG